MVELTMKPRVVGASMTGTPSGSVAKGFFIKLSRCHELIDEQIAKLMSDARTVM